MPPVTGGRLDLTVAWRLQQRARRGTSAALERIGIGQSTTKRVDDAVDYWSDSGSATWRSDSHWRDSPVFASDAEWLSVGADHVELARRLAPQVLDRSAQPRIIEWGAGGGANAVHFAPLAAEFVAVDINRDSLAECARQVGAVCSTPFRSVLADISQPEAVVGELTDGCDLFLCFYVFELVPSADYGLRLLRIAHRLLAPGGAAIIQIKYATVDRRTRSHTRRYRRNLANMTTYPIDQFWSHAESAGFTPNAVVLVPKNRLDERYAYFGLTRPDSKGSGSDDVARDPPTP